ncbi:mycothiol synthase [Candidatus Poriferisodalis sp.]|uniref:mycothiol synthase n=1 Tax=Candidatus Poriferisodalis sp. TaxID=3101277 RepID=UPI003B012F24
MSAAAGVPASADPVILIGADQHGAVVGTDASQWPLGALAAALRHQLDDIAGPVSVWIDHPDHGNAPESDAAPAETALGHEMTRLGLTFERDLYRMERSLPMDQLSGIETRSFVVGQDEAAWVEVNNRAFSWHREQGGWTLEQVAERQAEPWFDPDGFRVYDIDGDIAAYCWTKIHDDENPPVGEVYVIAVDPQYHGRGLGRALTLAGYEHLAAAGLKRATLYVDADNTPAVTLYLGLGLEVALVRRLFTGVGNART